MSFFRRETFLTAISSLLVDNAIISDLKLHRRTAAPPGALRNRERSPALCAKKQGEPIYKIMLAPAPPDPETRAKVAEEEKRDFELTTTYKGRLVRVEHNDGTVQVVKYDMVYILWSDGSQSSLKEAIAGALKAAKAREQQAQTVDAPQPLTLTPPSTPRRAPSSSPRGVDEWRPPAAPRKARAPAWPDGDGGATGGDRAPARHYHSPGPFEPGGADTLKQGIGVGGDGATGLAPVPPGRPPGQGRRRLSYDDDDPPGHQQDAPLLAKALLEDRAGAEGRLQASGGLRPPTPLKDVNREPTLELKPEPTRPKLKFRRAPVIAARLFASPPSPPPSPVPSRGRSSSSSSETSAHNYDINNKLLDGDVLQLFAAHADEFNACNLATAVHQIAKRNIHCLDDPRCDWLLAAVTSRVAEFSARQLAGIALSCCVAGILGPTLANAIADVLLVQPSREQLDEVLGSLGLSHMLAQRSVAEVVTMATGGLLNDADARENLGLDAEDAATLQLALTDVSDECLDELGPKGRSSLYPVLLYLQVEAPCSRLLRVLAKRRAELRAAYVRDDGTPSRQQTEVSKALTRLGWNHKHEFRTTEGLSLDMAQPSTKTAVEFDGPTHYLKSGRPNGATTFKTRLLETLGWRVIRIPYFEWDELRTRNDKKAYLRQNLGLATPARSRTSSITSDGSSPRSGRSRASSSTSWASSSGSSHGGAWTCSACTEVNPDPSHVRCYLCMTPRS